MLKTNVEKLVIQSVMGQIHHPVGGTYRISHEGIPQVLPATGAITYNVKVGDSVYGFAWDHVEPGVSIKNEKERENAALNLLSCIGNEAKVITGDAKGAKGYVTGTHGGIDHVLIYFKKEDLEEMAIEDKIQIKAFGQGLQLIDYPQIKIMNIDPRLFVNLNIKEENGKITIPVTAVVPPYLMGSGIGSSSSYVGDYDIMTADREEIKKNGLDKLRFGDIVMLKDCDNTYGRGYLNGSVSIGVVVHSDCIKMGHGPGVTTIMTCKEDLIKGIISEKANIASYLCI